MFTKNVQISYMKKDVRQPMKVKGPLHSALCTGF